MDQVPQLQFNPAQRQYQPFPRVRRLGGPFCDRIDQYFRSVGVRAHPNTEVLMQLGVCRADRQSGNIHALLGARNPTPLSPRAVVP